MGHTIKRVGIDLDHTVADFIGGAIPLIRKNLGLEPDLNVRSKHIKDVFNLAEEGSPANWKQLLFQEWKVFRHLPKLEEKIEQLTHELTKEANVYIITARHGTPVIVDDTLHWLDSNGFKYTDVFFTDEKTDLCQILDIDVMLDDDPAQIVPLIQANVNVVVRNQPWNQHLVFEGGVKRASHWKEMLEATKEFLQ